MFTSVLRVMPPSENTTKLNRQPVQSNTLERTKQSGSGIPLTPIDVVRGGLNQEPLTLDVPTWNVPTFFNTAYLSHQLMEQVDISNATLYRKD